jgi:hypothetical protein
VQLNDEFVREIRQIVWDHIETVLHARGHERSEAENRMAQLRRQPDKVLQAYYAEAIDTEQLKAAAERCCNLLTTAHEQYLSSEDLGRRDLNQAVFEKLYGRDDEVVGCDLRPPFPKVA